MLEPSDQKGTAARGRLPRLERLRRAYQRGRTARQLQSQALIALAGVNEGIWDWDLSRGEILLSERCYTLLGYPIGSLPIQDSSLLESVHPEDRDAACRLISASIGPGGCQQLELRVRHADGSWRWMLVRATGIADRRGRMRRLLGFLTDIGDRKHAEEALRENEARATAALAASGAAVWTIDFKRGGIETFDARAREIAGFGDRAEWPAGTFCSLLHPEDQPRLQAGFEAARVAGHSPVIEYRLVRADGDLRWLQGTGALQCDAAGHAVRFIGVSTDITGRKLAEQHRELLLRELGHRVKNILSIVQSIADQTARTAGGTTQFQSAFAVRLQALTRAHDLLLRRGWKGASLEALARAALAPFVTAGAAEQRLRISGPDLELAPMASVSLAMALHELATNAAKYGALAGAGGAVVLDWTIEPHDAERMVELRWIERGGEPPRAPERVGFGTRLVHAVAAELGGAASLAYPAEGCECVLRFPLSDRVVSSGRAPS